MEVEPLRFGVLVRCHECDLVLYLDGRGAGHDVSADDVRFLHAWNSTAQRFSIEAMKVIKEIGVRPELYRGDIAHADVACRVQIDGAWIDPARVVFMQYAPVGWPNVVLASAVTGVGQSPVALPLAVRDAATSDAPVLFRDAASGKFLRLQKGAIFLNEDGAVGRDVVICWRDDIGAREYEREIAAAPVVGTSEARMVVADLDDVARELLGLMLPRA